MLTFMGRCRELLLYQRIFSPGKGKIFVVVLAYKFFFFFFFFLRNTILFTDQNTYTTYNANIILTFTFKLHYSYLHYRYYLQNIIQYPHTIRLYNTTFRVIAAIPLYFTFNNNDNNNNN